ncbi:MAG TPA: hypothetical protein PLY93_13490, partial [Turneriella sp.]|nr:hypothetical protein [Turneriella sp.]
DFIGHAIRKFPNLSETDFILLTHRLELVPPRNYVYPVLEKPLRAAQIRQVVMQRMKYAQDIVAMQARAETETTVTLEERPVDGDAPKKKGIRDLLKINRKTENNDGETEKAASTSTNKKALKSAKASTKTTKELAPKKSVSKTKTSKLKKKS